MRTISRATGLIVMAAMVVLAVGGIAGATGTPGVDPASTSATLLPGQSILIPKVVHTSTIPPKPDLIFLSDTTGSMGSAIANVKANAVSVMNSVLGAQPDSEFGAAQYKDFNCDAVPYNLDQAVTANTGAVQTAINTWSAGGGCDLPESAINALYQLATDPAVGFRTGSSRII